MCTIYSTENVKIIVLSSGIDKNSLAVFPDKIMIDHKTFLNCSSVMKQEAFRTQITSERSVTLILKNNITSTTKISAGVKYGVLSVGADRTVRVQLDKTVSEVEKEFITRTHTSNYTIPVNKGLRVKASLATSKVQWPYKAEVILEGSVKVKQVFCRASDATNCSAPIKKFGKTTDISNYIADADRKMIVEGIFENVEVSNLIISYAERDLVPSDCPWNGYSGLVSGGPVLDWHPTEK